MGTCSSSRRVGAGGAHTAVPAPPGSPIQRAQIVVSPSAAGGSTLASPAPSFHLPTRPASRRPENSSRTSCLSSTSESFKANGAQQARDTKAVGALDTDSVTPTHSVSPGSRGRSGGSVAAAASVEPTLAPRDAPDGAATPSPGATLTAPSSRRRQSQPLPTRLPPLNTRVGSDAEDEEGSDKIAPLAQPRRRRRRRRSEAETAADLRRDPAFHDSYRHPRSPGLRTPGNEIRWKRGELIGKGANGTVYLGLDLRNGQLMAAKEVLAQRATEDRLRALRREIRLLQSLEHPHIVRYIGTVTQDSKVYIFTEWVPGGSLGDVLKRFGKLSVDVVRKYTRQMLLGLQHLHAKNVIHRDIKPGNVLISTNGVVKLADFGESEKLEIFADGSVRGMSRLMGTPYYMSPELIRLDPDATGREADVWALGATVLHLVTGVSPWKESGCKDPHSLFRHIAMAEAPPAMPDDFADDLREFLERCMEPDFRKRAGIDELLQHTFLAPSMFETDDASADSRFIADSSSGEDDGDDMFGRMSDDDDDDDDDDEAVATVDDLGFGLGTMMPASNNQPGCPPYVTPGAAAEASCVAPPPEADDTAPTCDISLSQRRALLFAGGVAGPSERPEARGVVDARSQRAAQSLFRASGMLPDGLESSRMDVAHDFDA